MIEVKRLKQGDEELAREIIAGFWPDGQLKDEFFSKETNYLLAGYVDGVFAGFLYAYELDRIDQQNPMMFLYSIDVLAEYRRQGIGKRLIEEIKSICTERRVCKMFVLTHEGNEPAMRLYQSTGGKRDIPDNVLFEYKEK
jgi:ribosomal protein S18 acetylase RimI-like enzyme